MWVLTRHADVHQALRCGGFSAGLIPQLLERQAGRAGHADLGLAGRLALKSLVFTEGPDHARLRGLVNRVFTSRSVATRRPHIARIARALADRAGPPAAST